MRPAILLFVALVAFGSMARDAGAAELAGVTMPDTETAVGAHLVLNGMAVRTYSFVGIKVYVAGLYLPARSADAEAIIGSRQPMLFRFVFLRDVKAVRARESWRTSFDESCHAPCVLPAAAVGQFLAAVPDLQKGDVSTLLFTGHSLDFALNGRPLGTISDPTFARVILSTYIGEHPSSAAVKQGLLGLGS